MSTDVLEKIKKNELRSTRFYDANWEPDNNSDISTQVQSDENYKRWKLYRDVLGAIGDKHVDGNLKDESDPPHYDDLYLTEEGEKFLKLVTTPLNDMVKPSLKEVIVKGILSRIVVVPVVAVVFFVFKYFFPQFTEDALLFIATKLDIVKGYFL